MLLSDVRGTQSIKMKVAGLGDRVRYLDLQANRFVVYDGQVKVYNIPSA